VKTYKEGENARIRLEDIIEELSQDGWKVLSDTYKT